MQFNILTPFISFFLSLSDIFIQQIQQFSCYNRLCHIIIATSICGFLFVAIKCISSESDNGYIFILFANFPSCFQSIHNGHFNIHQDNIRMMFAIKTNSFLSVISPDKIIPFT